MQYAIRHTTAFNYSAAVRESVMELRMEPRTDDTQRCLEFNLDISPEAVAHRYIDPLGNVVHHFDIPGIHQDLEVVAAARVELLSTQARSVRAGGWADLDEIRESPEFWDWLHPSHFACPSDRVHAFAEEIHLNRRTEPLGELNKIQEAIGRILKYERGSTRVDSTIDECLQGRKGVCQDFVHLFIALARGIGIPCRYVSGYLFQSGGPSVAENATHAWAEGYLPGSGWVGFDPANRTFAGADHIRVAVGRDYHDVPPTRGTFRGVAETRLKVKVAVSRA